MDTSQAHGRPHGTAPRGGRVLRQVLGLLRAGFTAVWRRHGPVMLLPSVFSLLFALLFVYLIGAGWLYPLRPDVWASLGHLLSADPRLDSAWGGPTLLGAWMTHAAIALGMQAGCLLVIAGVERLGRATSPRAPADHRTLDPK